MNQLLIIDDTDCHQDFSEFIRNNRESVRLILSEENYAIELEKLISELPVIFDHKKYFTFKTDSATIKVEGSQIIKVERANDKSALYLKNTHYLLEYDFEELKDQLLSENFIEINPACVVNIDKIETIKKLEAKIILRNKKVLCIDKRYIDNIIDAIENQNIK